MNVDYRDVVQLFAKLKFRDGKWSFHSEMVLTDGSRHEVDSALLNDLARQIRADSSLVMRRLYAVDWDYQYTVAERQPEPEPLPPAPNPYAAYGTRSYDWRRIDGRRRNPITGHFIGGDRGER